ncbi:uncharacterized protein LOC122212395 [Panthera leo]|uniref:uncharacterized protein LOC122212395 n=1 Tax=Panthera leo TaxID=9689 RepID=UPI001C6A84D9|nr:uncharacterized protein LOC122212395 [Panthera leo]
MSPLTVSRDAQPPCQPKQVQWTASFKILGGSENTHLWTSKVWGSEGFKSVGGKRPPTKGPPEPRQWPIVASRGAGRGVRCSGLRCLRPEILAGSPGVPEEGLAHITPLWPASSHRPVGARPRGPSRRRSGAVPSTARLRRKIPLPKATYRFHPACGRRDLKSEGRVRGARTRSSLSRPQDLGHRTECPSRGTRPTDLAARAGGFLGLVRAQHARASLLATLNLGQGDGTEASVWAGPGPKGRSALEATETCAMSLPVQQPAGHHWTTTSSGRGRTRPGREGVPFSPRRNYWGLP